MALYCPMKHAHFDKKILLYWVRMLLVFVAASSRRSSPGESPEHRRSRVVSTREYYARKRGELWVFTIRLECCCEIMGYGDVTTRFAGVYS